MNIIICIDDNNGMLFNNRRQSRDRNVISDIANDIQGNKLKISEFSQNLFLNSDIEFFTDEKFLDNAAYDDFCFVENRHLHPYINKINMLTVYRWNRLYPSDFKLDISLDKEKLISHTEFAGYSHPQIIKEVYNYNVTK